MHKDVHTHEKRLTIPHIPYFVHGMYISGVLIFGIGFPQNDRLRLCLLEQWVLNWAYESGLFQSIILGTRVKSLHRVLSRSG